MTAPASKWPYSEWARLTRFVESGRLAFAHERERAQALQVDSSPAPRIKVSKPGGGEYRMSLARHLQALEDEHTFHAAVLVHSYALLESAAAAWLQLDQRRIGPIEDWGTALLAQAKTDWSAVDGGLVGAVEVAVYRNAVAHGEQWITAAVALRLHNAGSTEPLQDLPITLDYEHLARMRTRMVELLNAGQVGLHSHPSSNLAPPD